MNKMVMNKKHVIRIVLLLLGTSLAFGHGVKVTAEKKSPFIIIGAGYHAGKALGYADVTIRFETDEADFQTGSTDKNGNFCFYPDRPGKWTASVDDGMGHRGKKDILLDDAFFNPPPPPAPSDSPAAPVKEEQPKELKEAKVVKEESVEKEKKEEKKIPLTQNDMCCYLLKIVLGVVLILVITLILHHWKKKMESGKEK